MNRLQCKYPARHWRGGWAVRANTGSQRQALIRAALGARGGGSGRTGAPEKKNKSQINSGGPANRGSADTDGNPPDQSEGLAGVAAPRGPRVGGWAA